jgi:hypothetical protein
LEGGNDDHFVIENNIVGGIVRNLGRQPLLVDASSVISFIFYLLKKNKNKNKRYIRKGTRK